MGDLLLIETLQHKQIHQLFLSIYDCSCIRWQLQNQRNQYTNGEVFIIYGDNGENVDLISHMPSTIFYDIQFCITTPCTQTRKWKFAQTTNAITTFCGDLEYAIHPQSRAQLQKLGFHSNGKRSMSQTTNAVILIVPSSTAVWHINSNSKSFAIR